MSELPSPLPRPSLFRAGGITFGAQFSIFLLRLGISVILARALGADGRGSFALAVLIVLVLIRIGSLGLEIANVYFTAGDRHPLPSLTANSLLHTLAATGLLLLLIGLAPGVPFVLRYLNANGLTPGLLLLAGLSMPFTMLIWFFVGILQGRERPVEFNLPAATVAGFQAIMLAAFLLLLGRGLTTALQIYVAAQVAGAAVACFFVFRLAPFSLSPDRQIFRAGLKFGSRAWVANLAQFLNYRLDQFIVAGFLGPAALGFYAVAVGIVERAWMVPQSVALVLFPRSASLPAEEANALTPKIGRAMIVFLLLLVTGVGLLAGWLVPAVWGTEFAPSVLPLRLLLPGILALGYGKILMSDLLGRGRPEIGMLSSTVSLVLTLLLDLVLIPRYGIAGAAVASSTAYTVGAIIIAVAFLRVSGLRWYRLFQLEEGEVRRYCEFLTRLMSRNPRTGAG